MQTYVESINLAFTFTFKFTLFKILVVILLKWGYNELKSYFFFREEWMSIKDIQILLDYQIIYRLPGIIGQLVSSSNVNMI